jgi:hypothetical protein
MRADTQCGGVVMTTLEARYEGGWQRVRDDCLLCEMEKRTHWYLETPHFVVAEKLGGGPFVVYKSHQETLSDEEWGRMEHAVEMAGFDDFEIAVRMNLVEDHWHGHIVTDEEPDLSDE